MLILQLNKVKEHIMMQSVDKTNTAGCCMHREAWIIVVYTAYKANSPRPTYKTKCKSPNICGDEVLGESVVNTLCY